jgi:nitroimidazol reductase NimA-like FMN-containing flavoprotein (pyridoxamine 5'-phosphate oxidase superfamily)
MNKKKQLLIISGICWMCLMLYLNPVVATDSQISEKQEPLEIKIGRGEVGVEATVIEGPLLKSDQVLTKDHPEYARGMVCVECHKVTFDALTSSTKQFILNYPQLSNDEVWERIESFLPGRERFVLTTVYNNEPTATTVDMVLDRDQKVFYVLCEKGTEKLSHIKQNPRISAVHFAGWTLAAAERDPELKKEWMSIQIRGTAEVIPPDDSRFETIVKKYKPARLSLKRAVLRFDTVRITPTSAIYFNTNLYGEKLGVYQHWERN